MIDYTIGNVHVQDITGLDANGSPTVTKRVTFMVGKHGPFTLNYAAQNYIAERVRADIQKEVDTLKAIVGE